AVRVAVLWPTFTMLAQHPLDVFDIVRRELSGLHKPRHYRLHLATKQTQQIVNETSLRLVARNGRFKHLRFADSLHQTQSLLVFEAINGGLHRRIRRFFSFGKRFLNLTDRTRAALPEGFHDRQFEPGQFGQFHVMSYEHRQYTYTYSNTSIPKGTPVRILFTICSSTFWCKKEDVALAAPAECVPVSVT